MEGMSLPCSVIISHGEAANLPAGMEEPHQQQTVQVSNQVPTEDQSPEHIIVSVNPVVSFPDGSVFELVQVLPSTSSETQESSCSQNNDADIVTEQRTRMKRRPFSPQPYTVKKNIDKRTNIKRKKTNKVPDKEESQFCCASCKSPYIVNPSRRRRAKEGKVRPRRVLDMATNTVQLMCNACGLATFRARKKIINDLNHTQMVEKPQEDRKQYLQDATQFANSLAESLGDPEASQFYCPSFKSKSCSCLQKYISGTDKDEYGIQERAGHLLSIIKQSRQLKQSKLDKNYTQTRSKEEQPLSGDRGGGRKRRRSKQFEDFILSTRKYLRQELKLCERACQKVLLYSNNFLRKKLKTSPSKSPRLAKQLGARSLTPISELPSKICCIDKCVMVALTHSRLLETWREATALGQRDTWRVLAEMLTPCGGAKSNCYKFINMVTGCSMSTICHVAAHMKRTRGEREPPEHGLKRYWRQHPRNKTAHTSGDTATVIVGNSGEEDPLAIHIPSVEELTQLDMREACKKLHEQRDKLAQLHLQLSKKKQKQMIGENSVQIRQTSQDKKKLIPVIQSTNHKADNSRPQTSQQQIQQRIIHILEIPNPEPAHPDPQPTISVMNSSGEFEPLSNLALGCPNQDGFSNVILVPGTTQGPSVVRYCDEGARGEGVEHLKTYAAPSVTKTVGTFQLYNVLDSETSATNNLIHFNY